MKKIKNKRGEVVELKTGSALRQAMKGIAEKDKRLQPIADSLAKEHSSLLFRSYLEQEGVTLKDAIRAFGFNNVGLEQVRTLYENDNTKPLFNMIIEDGIRMGFAKTGRADQLITRTIPIDQMQYGYYTMENVDKEELDFRLVGQAAPIPVMRIQLDDKKVVRVYKRGGGIEITDEAKSMNIDMLSLHLMLRGQRMGRTDEYLAIERLLNGYFADGSDAAPVLGVRTPNDWRITDVWYAAQYMLDTFGFTPKRTLMNLKTAEKWADMKDGNGQSIFLSDLKAGTMPDVLFTSPFITDRMPDNRIMLVDTDFALAEYEYKPLSVENDRNVKTQVEGSYASKSNEYVTFEKNARMILTLDEER